MIFFVSLDFLSPSPKLMKASSALLNFHQGRFALVCRLVFGLVALPQTSLNHFNCDPHHDRFICTDTAKVCFEKSHRNKLHLKSVERWNSHKPRGKVLSINQ
jgi:hypothetical protein